MTPVKLPKAEVMGMLKNCMKSLIEAARFQKKFGRFTEPMMIILRSLKLKPPSDSMPATF